MSMDYKIEKIALKEKILAVYCNESIYLGLSNKFINYSTQKILCIHQKPIRSISGNQDFIGCCSYDGTATVFLKNEKLKDKIEGPDTEIKGIAFENNIIAITTRGKTTWILEDFEISKILEDHTQDVKGCKFYKKRLYTWSYDNTIKVYQLFDIDHSWELVQSIDLENIIWNIIFYKDKMCAILQNGYIAILKEDNSMWSVYKMLRISLTPIYSACVFLKDNYEYLAIVCNINCLLILNEEFEKILEIAELNEGSEIFSSDSLKNQIVLGSIDGTLTIITIK